MLAIITRGFVRGSTCGPVTSPPGGGPGRTRRSDEARTRDREHLHPYQDPK
jgi:hypothetical protein